MKKTLRLLITGDRTVKVVLVTQMSTGKSHIEVSLTKRVKIDTDKLDDANELAEQLINEAKDL